MTCRAAPRDLWLRHMSQNSFSHRGNCTFFLNTVARVGVRKCKNRPAERLFRQRQVTSIGARTSKGGNIAWIIFSMSGRDSISSGRRAECAAHFPLCVRVRVCVTLKKGFLTVTSVLNGFNFTRRRLKHEAFLPQKLKAPCERQKPGELKRFEF